MIHVSWLEFNVVQDQNLDTFNYLHVNNPKAKECILTIKDELIDPYRESHEFEKMFHMAKTPSFKTSTS